MLLFARRPLSETSLRDIAAEAQVDVAYVHRAFGSKAEIFRQALNAVAPLDEIFAHPADPDSVIERLAERTFLRDPLRVEDVEPLHLIIRSCVCSEARSILDGFIEASLARPLADSFGHEDLGRAMFAVSILSGFATMRLVVGNSTLRSMPRDTLKTMLTKALHEAMSA